MAKFLIVFFILFIMMGLGSTIAIIDGVGSFIIVLITFGSAALAALHSYNAIFKKEKELGPVIAFYTFVALVGFLVIINFG